MRSASSDDEENNMEFQMGRFLALVVAASIGLFAHSAVYAQAVEIEPNDRCEAPQDLDIIDPPFFIKR